MIASSTPWAEAAAVGVIVVAVAAVLIVALLKGWKPWG